MGGISLWHWLIVLAIVMLLFARPGRLSGIMEDLGKGIKGFRKGMSDPSEQKNEDPPRQVADRSNEDRAQ
jgi:sec-independent protein translocase protein TatA